MSTSIHYFPEGDYYIGDPCYVIPDDDWDELIDNTGCFGLHSETKDRKPITNWDDGVFYWNGEKCFASGTAYGDGCYSSNIQVNFGVDAGLIGIIPVKVISSDTILEAMRLGALRRFYDGFEVIELNGLFYFGDVKIDTN